MWSEQVRRLRFFLLPSARREKCYCEDDPVAAHVLGPGTDMFGAQKVCGEVLVGGVPGLAMYRGEVNDEVCAFR